MTHSDRQYFQTAKDAIEDLPSVSSVEAEMSDVDSAGLFTDFTVVAKGRLDGKSIASDVQQMDKLDGIMLNVSLIDESGAIVTAHDIRQK